MCEEYNHWDGTEIKVLKLNRDEPAQENKREVILGMVEDKRGNQIVE
jgi:hypothetical protein